MKKIIFLILAVFAFLPEMRAQKLSLALKTAVKLTEKEGKLAVDSVENHKVFVVDNDSGVVFLHLQDGSFASIEIHTRGGTLGAYCYPQDSTGKIGIRRYVWIKEFLQEYLSKELNAPQLQIGFELTLREKKIIKEADKIIFKEVRKITKEEKKK